MIVKFTGKCIDTMADKRGTLYLIVEESSEGKPLPQKVKCWGRAIEAAAKGVRPGDTVTIEARQEARRWEPKDGSPPVWFDGLNAVFIEVAVPDGDPRGNPQPVEDIDDVPF